MPFYCDPKRTGHFAVESTELTNGNPTALFKLFVCLAMYQARRDVVIMRQQASMSLTEVQSLVSMKMAEIAARQSPCEHLSSAVNFDANCDVYKFAKNVDCHSHPGAPCHVKNATALLNRMGDMGKLPTSAWLNAWQAGRLTKLLEEVQANEVEPQLRAQMLVTRFASIYRVGEKLATMFVSALSTPALAQGLTPWFPNIDGNALVVVDTNVALAVSLLQGPPLTASYAQKVRWIREQALSVDLREFDSSLPRYSPRLIQQALYRFCSKSNRLEQFNDCEADSNNCSFCVPLLCPFIKMKNRNSKPAAPQSTKFL